MGNKETREKWVRDEFNALIAAKQAAKEKPRNYTVSKNGQDKLFLILSDIQKFKQPPNADITLDCTHLGTLFAIAKTKDGRFYCDEIIDFVHLYFERQAQKTNTVDIVKEFQGYCTLQLWNYVNRKGGKEKFVEWFGLLLSRGNTTKIPGSKNKYVGRAAVKSLHEIFSITKSYGVEQSTSFSTMYTVAKEKNWIDSNHSDFLPIQVLEFFGTEFIEGFMNYMKELGFEPDMEVS
eukprot:TRINITY_DN24501_c0_g1_i1.p1 TRINITY_DN24501_c0_g1~~TRINITY_DN24501_c0_g1_i1.p1  ORF type:complete len:235 (-),score=51.77 TRINITY_DN24501_c0_g1_i1:49-753(-)